MASVSLQKVLCLEEGLWEGSLTDRTSVRPTLSLLEDQEYLESFIYREFATRAEFDRYIEAWRKHHRDFGLVYLTMHGTREGLEVGNDTVPLRELAKLMGRRKGMVVHLGSCSVLQGQRRAANAFLDATNARAISGFARDVDQVESAAFDLILLSYLAYYEQVGTAYRRLYQHHRGLIRYLKFVCYPPLPPLRAKTARR